MNDGERFQYNIKIHLNCLCNQYQSCISPSLYRICTGQLKSQRLRIRFISFWSPHPKLSV